jgi:adenine-specific DNA-methyltransferase
MAKKQKPADDALKNVSNYRFPGATRKNNPPAKIAAEGCVPPIPKAEYLYRPRRPPELRFYPTGRADELPELLAKATSQKLTEAEAWALAEALRVHEPWLEWAGKRVAHPRTRKRAGHPESSGARGREPLPLRRPGTGSARLWPNAQE